MLINFYKYVKYFLLKNSGTGSGGYPAVQVLGIRRFRVPGPGTGSDGYPAGSGSKKMRTGTGLNRFRILGTGTGTNHIGSGSRTGGSKAVPVPKAGTRFRCSPLGKLVI